MAPAAFTGTKICLNATRVPELGGLVHVLMYQNTVASSAGPNAMLLHLPADDIGQKNFIDTRRFPHILDDMVDVMMPRARGGAKSMGGTREFSSSRVQMFEVGIYTILLARDASDIPSALNRVPANKRPKVNRALFDFYASEYPGYAVALCCFDNSNSKEAEPIMVWYRPANRSGRYRLPALDCHTGAVPDLNAQVQTDHWVFMSTNVMQGGHGVRYREEGAIPPHVRALLPNKVYGAYFGDRMQNGDFGILQPEHLALGSKSKITRLPPPGRQAAAVNA